MACMLRCCHCCWCLWNCVTLPFLHLPTSCSTLAASLLTSLHSYKKGCSNLPSQTVAMPAAASVLVLIGTFSSFRVWRSTSSTLCTCAYFCCRDALLVSLLLSMSLPQLLTRRTFLPLFRTDRHSILSSPVTSRPACSWRTSQRHINKK